jgi:hypothetical protein
MKRILIAGLIGLCSLAGLSYLWYAVPILLQNWYN